MSDAPTGVAAVEVNVVTDGSVTRRRDVVTVEEPLEIRLVYGRADQRLERSVAVTMRTPGDDVALALGFLHGEGVLRTMDDVTSIGLARRRTRRAAPATWSGWSSRRRPCSMRTRSRATCTPRRAAESAARRRSTRCGSRSPTTPGATRSPSTTGRWERCPSGCRTSRRPSLDTGGLHASGTFDASGRIETVAEDVGRHNALDKLVGGYLSRGSAAHDRAGLIFSGRASFELVQKAAMAGCPFVAAIGPPSSLAVELAAEQRMTLVGFLREHRFNIYTMPHRVVVGN